MRLGKKFLATIISVMVYAILLIEYTPIQREQLLIDSFFTTQENSGLWSLGRKHREKTPNTKIDTAFLVRSFRNLSGKGPDMISVK